MESGGGGHHWRASGVNGGDDFFGVDALEVDAGRAEVGVAELPLDHVERHALAREGDGMRMAQLVRPEAAPDTRLGASRRNSTRALALDQARPRVGPSIT